MIYGHPLDRGSLSEEFSPDVVRLVEDVPEEAAGLNRAVLAGLTWRTLRSFDESRHGRVPALVVLTGVAAAFSGSTLLAVWGVVRGTLWLLPEESALLVVEALAVFAYVAAVAHVLQWRGRIVDLGPGPIIDRLRLGQFDAIFSNRSRIRAVRVLGILVGLHWGLLYWVPVAVGTEATDVEGAALLVVDNVFHGWLLDVFELYDIRIGDVRPEGTRAVSVLLAFRFGLDLVLAVLVYSLLERRSARTLLQRLPREFEERRVVDWLGDVLRSRAAWTRWFPDEALFLMIVRDYAEGRFDDVRETTLSFPRLRVADRLKGMFVDKLGAPTWLEASEASAIAEGPVQLDVFESEPPVPHVESNADTADEHQREDDESDFEIEIVSVPDP